MSDLIEWIIGFFVESDLVDLNISEAEECERACYDSLAAASVNQLQDDDPTPDGKKVL